MKRWAHMKKPHIKRSIVARNWMWLCIGRGQVGIGCNPVAAFNTWQARARPQ